MTIKNTFALVLFLVSAATLSAQTVVMETERTMSFGSRPAFRLEFRNTAVSTVESMWKDFAKKNFNAKLKKDKKSGELVASDLESSMVASRFAIYSTVEKVNDGAALTVWIDGGSYFLNRRDDSGHTEEISRALRTLYYDVRRTAIGEELKEQQDKMVELEKKQKSLKKDNDDLHKDIENYKAKIKKAEEDIVKNEKDQESNMVDQESQRRQLEETQRRINNVESEQN